MLDLALPSNLGKKYWAPKRVCSETIERKREIESLASRSVSVEGEWSWTGYDLTER